MPAQSSSSGFGPPIHPGRCYSSRSSATSPSAVRASCSERSSSSSGGGRARSPSSAWGSRSCSAGESPTWRGSPWWSPPTAAPSRSRSSRSCWPASRPRASARSRMESALRGSSGRRPVGRDRFSGPVALFMVAASVTMVVSPPERASQAFWAGLLAIIPIYGWVVLRGVRTRANAPPAGEDRSRRRRRGAPPLLVGGIGRPRRRDDQSFLRVPPSPRSGDAACHRRAERRVRRGIGPRDLARLLPAPGASGAPRARVRDGAVSDSPVFDRTCDELEQRTTLDRLAARGTVRIALKSAGLEVTSVDAAQMGVVLRGSSRASSRRAGLPTQRACAKRSRPPWPACTSEPARIAPLARPRRSPASGPSRGAAGGRCPLGSGLELDEFARGPREGVEEADPLLRVVEAPDLDRAARRDRFEEVRELASTRAGRCPCCRAGRGSTPAPRRRSRRPARR